MTDTELKEGFLEKIHSKTLKNKKEIDNWTGGDKILGSIALRVKLQKHSNSKVSVCICGIEWLLVGRQKAPWCGQDVEWKGIVQRQEVSSIQMMQTLFIENKESLKGFKLKKRVQFTF